MTIRTLRNPKTGEAIETSLSEEEAKRICSNLRSPFARDLAVQLESRGSLSPVQYYWLFKLASENNRASEEIQLQTDLQTFISVVPTMQFRVQLDNGTELGKVLLKTREDCVTVHAAYRCVGRIVGDKFYPTRKCWNNLKAQIILFGAAPMKWMEEYGKATGHCCVCGRELTNEESVSLGIGPICRSKWG